MLEPTAILPRGVTPPGHSEPRPAETSEPATPDRPAPGADPAGREKPSAPTPRVLTIGDIPGLSPRRRRGIGEVPAANVDLVDRLPRPQVWPTVAAWLQAQKSLVTRRGYLHCLTAFLRWLEAAEPGMGLWDVTEDVLVAYKDQISARTGPAVHLLKGGRPLGASTVAQRISALRSLYAYAYRRHTIRYDPAVFVDPPETPKVGMTPALAEQDAVALMDGVEAIADRHPLDAAAVALLLNIGLRTGELEAMPVRAFTWDRGHFVARFRVKGGKTIPVPVVPRVRVLLEPLLDGRGRDEFLLQHPDGRPWNRGRVTTALRRAARAANIRPDQLTPHVLRATAITLLLAAGVPPHKVQELVGHSDPRTTKRYDHSDTNLDGHAAYKAAGILAGD
ncbi:tyrosine-type recombinase/integrase [Actinomadura sp. 3N407]|uniref:tyrosine-type recombinase/integrase n=1 Tax=Actinomadura sp. 3N407 TaxID=3457423 RepID=UPI003FCE82E6